MRTGLHLIPFALLATLAACQPATRKEATGSGELAAPASVAARLLHEPDRRVMTLSNGFTVILQRNRTAPVAAARIYVKAGSITEQQYMGAGLSHVLEHLVAGASSGKREEDENSLLLQQIGNDSNAFTDSDQTCYFITTSADKLPIALDLLIDWTTNTNFTKEQFEREFKVVQRELEMGEAEPDRIFYQQSNAIRYLQHPARMPVIGFKTAFQRLTYEDAKAYFQQMYVPDNMIISVAGDIDLDATEAKIVEHVRGIKRKVVPAIGLPAEPPVTTPRSSVAHADVKEARINWAFPTVDIHDPDLYAADVLAGVLGGSESSILVRKLRDELGVVLAISCSDPTPSFVAGQLDISAVLEAQKIPAAQAALFAALDDVVKNGVPADAVERAKAQAAATLVYGNQTAEQQAIRNAADFMNAGNIDFSPMYVKRIQAVTPEQVHAAARKYLNRERLLTTTLLPTGVKDPFAAASTQTAAVEAQAVRKTVLRNGVTVLVSRNPAAPLAAVDLYVMGGLLAEENETNGTGATMMELMTRGTESRSHAQIADYLDATGTMLAAESGSNSFHLSLQCMKEKTAEGLALFADVALHPKFAADELQQVKGPLAAVAETATEDWYGEAYKAIKEAYYLNSPYRNLPDGNAKVIAALTPEQVRTHYQNYFLDPQKMVIAISGDIDVDAAMRWAAAFEAIPQKSPPLRMTSRAANAGVIRVPTKKESAAIMVAYPPGMTITSADRHAVTLLQTYLGGYTSQFGSVLFETLRGRGLVYTVQASNVSGPAGGMFLIAALGEPQNADAIAKTIQEIVERTKAGEIPDAKFEAAKDQAITGEKLSKLTIADKSANQALDELLGLGYDDDVRFPEKIRAVTKAEVVAAAKKYLNAPVVVIMTPEKK